MQFNPRNLVLWLALLALLGATAWALSFKSEPPADFTFCNPAEVKSLDPAVISGQIEGRIVDCLFEGLTRWDSKTLEALPGIAESWTLSSDKRTYTFHLRHNARWSDGAPFTAGDFLFAHRRALDPQTGCDYSYIYWMIRNAQKYNTLRVEAGDPVEIELNEHVDGTREFARGKMLHGKLVSVDPPFPKGDASDEGDESKPPPDRTYIVEIDGRRRTFKMGDGPDACKSVLLDFNEVGLKALDDYTYQVTLENPTAYFLQVAGMFPYYPVQQKCVETYGYPGWVEPDHIVTNGPFRLFSRKIRERTRLVKSDTYWGRDDVKLNTIDAMVIESSTTALNLYLTGKVDWTPTLPPTIIKQLLDAKRDDFRPMPEFTIFFYRLNTTRKPFDDVRVRRALNMSLNKQAIVEGVTRAGEVAARSLVPPVIRNYPAYAGYKSGICEAYDPKKAAELLADAGFPGGQGIERIPLLSNSDEARGLIAELAVRQWKETLGINMTPENQEWHSYLSTTRKMDYSIACGAWVGDYIDPNTFLNMFLTGGSENQTGWSNKRYDELIDAAGREQNSQRRLEDFHQAEQILMDEVPIIPVYVAVTRNMVRPYVHGFFENALDTHPLREVSVDAAERARYSRGERPR